MHSGPGIDVSLDSGDSGLGVGRSDGGTAEKWVYEAPERSASWLIEGAMKTSEAGVSRATTSSSACKLAILRVAVAAASRE
jgi:hypothetical protein